MSPRSALIRHSLTLLPDLAQVGRARRFITESANDAGFPEARCFDIAVASSEACANAIEHSPRGREVSVEVALYADRLEVQVGGHGDFELPDLASDRQHRGLGLPLMAVLSDNLALYSRPEGGTLTQLTFYRPEHVRPSGDSPLPPSLVELFQTSERLESLLDCMPGAFGIVGGDWRWLYLNDAAVFGDRSAKGDLMGRTIWDDRADLVESGFVALLQKVKKAGASFREEIYNAADDSWSEVTAFPFAGGVAFFNLSVTERNKAEKALRESEERLRRSQEIAHLGSWELDLATNELSWSDEVYRIFGLTPQQFGATYDAFLEHVHPDDRAAVDAAYSGSLREGRDSYEIEHRVVRASTGETRWVHEKCAHLRDTDGGIVRSAGMILDTTERRAVESQLETELAAMTRLHELSVLGDGDIELPVLLDAILGATVALHGADFGNIRLCDCDSNTLSIAAQRGFDQSFLNHFSVVNAADQTSCAMALIRLERVIVEDLESDPESLMVADVARKAGYRAVQSTPLLGSSGEPLGVLSTHFREVRTFTEHELRLTDLYAREAASAIHRHRVEQALRADEERYRALAADNERLYRQQLEIAENLQSALLHIPSELGPLRLGHLYRSATLAARIGGDFYDVFEVKDGKIALLIGDVAGHGIEAARVAALTKDVIHAFAHQTLLPQQILRRTNSLLLEKDLTGFVSLFLGILDIDSLQLRWACAGHPDTMLRRSSGELQVLGGGSPPLGVYPDAAWKLGEVGLAPGDLLLLYTDGVTEARHEDEFFGEKRLQSILKRRRRVSVERLPTQILDRVLAFSGGRLHDDVAILSLLLTGVATEAKARRVPFTQESLLA